MEKLAYKPEEAQKVAGIGNTKFYAEVKSGRLITRKIGRRTEEIFDLVADDFRVEFGASAKSERAARASGRSPRTSETARSRPEKRSDPALERTVNMFLRKAGSCFQASSGAGEIQTRQPGKNFTLSYDYTWLTPERFERARAALQEYFNVLAEGRSAREGRLCSSLVLLQPVTPRMRGRASRRALPERTPAPRR